MVLTSEAAAMYGRLGGLASWAKVTDPTAATATARAVASTKLDERLALEHNIPLDGSEASTRRLAFARRLHFGRLAIKSAASRKRNRAARAAS